jgi:hypothetical protein
MLTFNLQREKSSHGRDFIMPRDLFGRLVPLLIVVISIVTLPSQSAIVAGSENEKLHFLSMRTNSVVAAQFIMGAHGSEIYCCNRSANRIK